MSDGLKVLLVEDQELDAELCEHELRQAGLQFTSRRVWTTARLAQALSQFHPDIMLDKPESMTIASSIISLAHALRMRVIAEGVESQEQAKLLRLLQCDEAQGYVFSKPVPWEQCFLQRP